LPHREETVQNSQEKLCANSEDGRGRTSFSPCRRKKKLAPVNWRSKGKKKKRHPKAAKYKTGAPKEVGGVKRPS